MKLLSGHEVEHIKGDELAQQQKSFLGYSEGLVRLHPGRWFLPSPVLKVADDIYEFQTKSDDVYIMTWPKCGTTWTQEIITTMIQNPNLDSPEIPSLNMRSPHIEFDMLVSEHSFNEIESGTPLMNHYRNLFPEGDPKNNFFLQLAQGTTSPRTLKTHFPFSLMPPNILENSKVVFVVRNPKDVIVSYLHHCRFLKVHDYVSTDEQFAEYFLKGDLVYGDYANFVKEGLEKRGHPNFHLIHFEDVKLDPENELRRLNKFLGTKLSDDQLTKIADYTSFNQMKNRSAEQKTETTITKVNESVIAKDGGFFRKGAVGDYKNKLSLELQKKVDEWIHQKFDGINFNFR